MGTPSGTKSRRKCQPCLTMPTIVTPINTTAASAAYQKALAEARAQAQSTIKETSDRLAADAAERQGALAATLAEQIAEAERRILATKEQALAEVRGIAVDVGRSVVEKLTGAAPDPAKLAAAVESSLSGRAH